MEEEKVKDGEILLTENEVWNVIEFARAFNIYPYMNPELVSARMREINLNPLQPTQDMLDKAMLNPSDFEDELQAFSQSFELSSMVYKRLLSYLGNMLSFDFTYTSNAKPEDYSTPKYKRDLQAFENFMDEFDFKKEFRIATKEMLRNEAFFCCLRDTGDGYVLQELPPKYCKITGRWGKGFLFSFNMYWFLLPGVDIDMYPKFFKKKYNEIWGTTNTTRKYDPALPPELRGKSSWIYWVDIPVDVGMAFKLTPELAARLPYFTPIFNDLILQPLVRSLQKNINMASASKMLLGQVPMLNKETKATVKDSLAISPDLLGKFMALVKSAISEAVKVGAMPLDDIKAVSFEGDNEMYDKYLRTALASSGINTNLIFSSSVKPNAIETQLSLNVDEQMMYTLYSQFEQAVSYWSNTFTKKFKFAISFEGTEFYLNRDKRFQTSMSLFNQGIVLPQKISASLGMKPWNFRKQMEEASSENFMASLTPPAVENQRKMQEFMPKPIAGKTKEDEQEEEKPEGRPRKDDSEIGEEGLNTRDSGNNVNKGGKV